METTFYQELTTLSLSGEILSDATCEKLLTASEIELLHFWMQRIRFAKPISRMRSNYISLTTRRTATGPEDCHYCAQANSATTDIEAYPLKPDAEILAEAARAHDSGAYRYCIVMSGRGPLVTTSRSPCETHPYCKSALPDRSVSLRWVG